MKIWHHSDGGNWVCCDGCDVWVHGECAKISGKLFKNFKDMDYYCPECKAMSYHGPSYLGTRLSKVRESIKYIISVQRLYDATLFGRKGCESCLPFLKKRSKVIEIVSAQDIVFALVQSSKPDAGFPLFKFESLKWPGFVEFDYVNGKVLTYSAQDRYNLLILLRNPDKTRT